VIETRIAGTLQYVKNTGHGFQLFEMSPDEYIYDPTQPTKTNSISQGKKCVLGVCTTQTTKGYSMIGGSKYDFFQVNWHTPSENTIDGRNLAMEAHFVHQLSDADLFGTAHQAYHRLAIIP
jgi:carbonic anhydrase